MAHAYETFAAGGKRIGGTLGTSKDGPVGIHLITKRNDPEDVVKRNKPKTKRILSAKLAADRDRAADRPRQAWDGGPRAIRRLRGWQDRHHRELRRRVVCGLHPALDDRRLGRLPQ